MSKHTEEDIPNSDEELEEYLEETLRLLNQQILHYQLESNHEQQDKTS